MAISIMRCIKCDVIEGPAVKSTAATAIQPVCLREKMLAIQVCGTLLSWTTDYLTKRLQYVQLHNCVSCIAVSSRGTP